MKCVLCICFSAVNANITKLKDCTRRFNIDVKPKIAVDPGSIRSMSTDDEAKYATQVTSILVLSISDVIQTLQEVLIHVSVETWHIKKMMMNLYKNSRGVGNALACNAAGDGFVPRLWWCFRDLFLESI